MIALFARAAKPLLFLAIAGLIVRVVVVGSGATDVTASIERYSALNFVPSPGLLVADAKRDERGVYEISDAQTGISPTCGCQAAHPDQWRGITFAGSEIELSRRGSSPYTEWRVSPSEPGRIAITNDKPRVFPVQVYRYKASETPDFKRDLVGELVSRDLSVISTADPSVFLKGKVPVGSWIPLPGSRVSVGRQEDPQLKSAGVVLTERYPKDQDEHSLSVPGVIQGHPMGEFLMPSTMVFIGGQTAVPGFLPPAADDEVTVIQPTDAYAFRLAAIAMTEADRQEYLAAEKKSPLIQTPAGSLTQSIAAPATASDGGEVSVWIKDPLDSTEYDAMRKTAQSVAAPRFDVWWLPETLAMAELENGAKLGAVEQFERGEQSYAYPPLPPATGINVFGKLERLTFSDAVGNLSVSGRDVSIPVPKTIELTDVSRMGRISGGNYVPFTAGTEGAAAEFDFSAVGDVSVAGESQTSVLKRRRDLFNAIIGLCGVLGVIATVVQISMSRTPPAPTGGTASS